MDRFTHIDKLGILQVKDRAARKGRNPQTGEQLVSSFPTLKVCQLESLKIYSKVDKIKLKFYKES